MPANYVLLERTELNASAASVTFANIPQTGYTDLKIVVSGRTDSGTGTGLDISFNGSTTGFTNRTVQGNGSAASSYGTYNRNAGMINYSPDTASTFGNTEIYIPNYTSSNNKSYSADGVEENNATTAFMSMIAGLWSNTAAITSVGLSPMFGNFISGSTFSLYGLAALGTTPVIAPKATGGNIIDFDGTYWIHTFLSSGTFTPQTGLSCDYLVVAGGGGGAPSAGTGSGGGGAGGYRTSIGGSPLSVTATNYAVTVGAGGAGSTSTTVLANGSDSVFSTITSTGGGGGGIATATPVNGGNGGSGGGGSAYFTNNKGLGNTPSTSPSQGNDGANGINLNINSGGGGGGSSAAGSAGSGTVAGNGGAGTANSISGTSVTYAGGGGGGAETGTAGTGGSGGGGNGSNQGAGTNGTANRGGGGGGSGDPMSGASAASGGSGIVIIRYLA